MLGCWNHQELLKKGIFLASLGPVYVSYSHEKTDVSDTLEKLDDVCSSLNEKISNDNFTDLLEGKIPEKILDMKISPTKKKS